MELSRASPVNILGGPHRYGGPSPSQRSGAAPTRSGLAVLEPCTSSVWESEERVRTRWASEEFEDVLTSVGFPSPKTADITILELHATEPPL